MNGPLKVPRLSTTPTLRCTYLRLHSELDINISQGWRQAIFKTIFNDRFIANLLLGIPLKVF